jgi:inhibitor of cysteine peptidase
MRVRPALLLMSLIALLVASQASASMVFVSQDENGHEFTLERGDALEISLPMTAGTGYTWQAEPVAGGIVQQVGEPEIKHGSSVPGARGLQIFHFARGAAGSGTLELRYLRPWDKNKAPAKVFRIKLTVR